MLKLSEPGYSFLQTMEKCREGITGNVKLVQKINSEIGLLKACADSYAESAPLEELYTLQPTRNCGNSDPLVIGCLRKSELLKLYSTYFVKSGKPGRKIYNSLLASANEQCPFCGGIGRPRNLDHYLPRTHYPQFSVLPLNLVPSCRDCNMDGKGASFAAKKGEQVIHPYLDHDRYFNEQWVFARYIAGIGAEPGVIEYFVSPPEHWDDAQKKRVEKHFNDFDLGLRFSKDAGPRLVIFLAQIQTLTRIRIELDVAKKIILQPVIDYAAFPNHWERVMCLALMNELA